MMNVEELIFFNCPLIALGSTETELSGVVAIRCDYLVYFEDVVIHSKFLI